MAVVLIWGRLVEMVLVIIPYTGGYLHQIGAPSMRCSEKGGQRLLEFGWFFRVTGFAVITSATSIFSLLN